MGQEDSRGTRHALGANGVSKEEREGRECLASYLGRLPECPDPVYMKKPFPQRSCGQVSSLTT